MTLGQFVQRFRKKQQKTQNDLAKASGLARSYIARLERGDYEDESIGLATFIRLAKALDVPMQNFFQEVTFLKEESLPPLGAVLQKSYARRSSRKK